MAAEILLAEALKHMIPQFGLRVSVLLDANGGQHHRRCAFVFATRHVDLKTTKAAGAGRHRSG